VPDPETVPPVVLAKKPAKKVGLGHAAGTGLQLQVPRSTSPMLSTFAYTKIPVEPTLIVASDGPEDGDTTVSREGTIAGLTQTGVPSTI
jgi:hypothetical protein